MIGVTITRNLRRMTRARYGTAVLLFTLLLSTAAHGDTGNLVIGARAQGLGSAFVAMSDDATGTYWNPAALTRLEAREASYTYWRLSDVSGVGVNFAALAVPLSQGHWKSAVGVSIVRVGAELEEGPAAQSSNISDSRYSLSLGLGLSEFVSVGVTLNRLQVDSEIESGSGFGFEVGVLVKPHKNHDLYLAATGRNLSADVKNESLEEAWRFGAAYTVWEERITFAGDVQLREDIDAIDGFTDLWYGGIEVSPVPEFSLRGGGGSRQQWGFGFGANHRDIHLDYALAGDDDVLGTSHRFTVSYRFGRGATP